MSAIAFWFVVPETNAPTLLERKAARLRKETRNNGYKSGLLRRRWRSTQTTLLTKPRSTKQNASVLSHRGINVHVYRHSIRSFVHSVHHILRGVSTSIRILVWSRRTLLPGKQSWYATWSLYAGTLSDRAIKKKLQRMKTPNRRIGCLGISFYPDH